MKKYIDFDGVVKDTYIPLFEGYIKQDNHDYVSDKEHVIKKDWMYVLKKSPIINNAIEIINSMNDVSICTRIHSLENEGVAKIRDLRSLGVKCDIILVPYQVKKTDVVYAKDAILVDDAIFNLEEWEQAEGFPIFFDLLGTNVDGWGYPNKRFVRTRTLDILKKY